MKQYFQITQNTRIVWLILICILFGTPGYSQQFNWEEQESGTTYTLFGISFTDENTGWAVGGNNGILFEQLTSGLSSTSSFYQIEAVNESTAWAVTTSDLIQTTDGGKTWVKKAVYAESISFIDKDKGWYVYGTSIYITSDGGDSWDYQANSSSSLKCIFAYDENHAWCVGYNGNILSTIDGGNNWETQTSGTTNTLYSVFFVNDTTGWAVGVQGTILATTNGGAEWIAQTSGTTEDLNSVHFFDKALGGIAADEATILTTLDGGNTWNLKSGLFWPPYDLNSIRFKDASTGYAVGVFGTIFKTSDGGNSWKKLSLGNITSWLNGIDISGESVWIVGSSNVILKLATGFIAKTVNSGETWEKQTSGTNSTLYSIHTYNSQVAWAVGGEGTVLKTNDGGDTWTSQNSGQTNNLYDIYFVDSQRGWISGQNGTILKTENGGELWEEQTTNTTDTLFSVFFTDELKGSAVGNFGTLLKTNNGGQDWDATKVSVYTLESVYFVDASIGYIAGLNGTILKTVDGGDFWMPLNTNTSGDFYDIMFAAQNTGWVIGSGGIILKTTSAGEIWVKQAEMPNVTFRSVFPVSIANIFAAGINGAILHSTDDQDLTAPVITITQPSPGQTFTLVDLPLTISGAVEDENECVCMVNGEYTNLVDGVIDEAFCLSPFVDSIIVRASDKAGNLSSSKIPVNTDIDLPAHSSKLYLGQNDDLVSSRPTSKLKFEVYLYTEPWNFDFSTVASDNFLVNRCGYAIYFYSNTKAVTLTWYIKRNNRKIIVAQETMGIASAGLYEGEVSGKDQIILAGDTLGFEITGAYKGGFAWGSGVSGGYITVGSDKSSELPAPVLLLPANNSIGNPVSLTLEWRSVAGATEYLLQADDNSDFDTPLYSYSLSDTIQPISGLSYNTIYYWRVAAISSTDTSGWTETWKFTTVPEAPDIPVLISPENNSTVQGLTHSLIWNAAARAETYSLQVSESSDFSSTFLDESGINATSREVGGLSDNTTYYWRVNASNTGGISAWSATYNFTTVTAPKCIPTLYNPSDFLYSIKLRLTLEWSCWDADSSWVQVACDPGFATGIVADTITSLTEYSLWLDYESLYYWRVRPFKTDIEGEWSQTSSFETPLKLYINVLEPDTGSVLYIWSEYMITWEDNLNDATYVIDLFSNDSKTNHIGVSFDEKQYLWTIYPSVEPGNDYYIVVKDSKSGITGSSGIISVTDDTGIDELTQYKSRVKIYPLPATKILTLEFTGTEIINPVLTLISADGRKIITEKVQNRIQRLYLDGIEKGMYILQITGSGYREYHKVYIE